MKKLTITFTDGTVEEITYPQEARISDGVLLVFRDHYGDRSARYPLTSIKKWETEK
jgi:hypothetical protein